MLRLRETKEFLRRSENKVNCNKKAFYIHKADSIKKSDLARSNSPIKSVISNIHSTSKKIKMLKLNSIAFNKRTSDQKESSKDGDMSPLKSNSHCNEEEKSFSFSPNKNNERMIISPIR